MATVDRISLRKEFEECQKTFEHLRDEGRMNPEVVALVNAPLLLLKLAMAVFLEKTTRRCQHATREDEGYRDGRDEKHGPFPSIGAGTALTDPSLSYQRMP